MDFFKSKKFWATVLNILFQILGKSIGIDEDIMTSISATGGAYVLGQGIADIGKYAK